MTNISIPTVFTALALLFLGTASLTGCNTAEGFGKDVENTGATISKTADEAEEEMSE